MRFMIATLLTALAAATSIHAEELITQKELDDTLLAAQEAALADDFPRAFELYSRAAQWGHKGSQYVLGELYLRGKGVARDPVVGAAWLEVASEAPDQEYKRALRKAEKSLTESERAAADKLAEKISAAYGMRAAGVVCRTSTRTGSNFRQVNCAHSKAPNGELIVPDYQGEIYPAS